MIDMPQKVKDALENTIVKVGSKGSAYDPRTDTIYVGKNASLNEVIHEIGHAIEGKLFNKKLVELVKQQCIQGSSARDIERVTVPDSAGNKTKILVVRSKNVIAVSGEAICR